MVADVSFRVMGSRARVVVNGADHDGLASWAVERLEQLEGLWSRFRPDSEISVLNEAEGRPTRVSTETVQLIERAIESWEATSGFFDPTMLDRILHHGYDRSHPDLPPATGRAVPPPLGGIGHDPTRISRCGDIMIDHRQSIVTLPPGVGFDPGGIGKGLGADLVATELLDRGAAGAMVELGGDVRVTGEHPDHGATWTVLIDDPRNPGTDRYRIGLTGGGIATSSQLLRRWSTDAGDRHHLLDPRTGDPSTSTVAAAVVASREAWQAEVLAKSALTSGFGTGPGLLDECGAVGVLFDFDGDAFDVGLLAAATPA